MNEISDQELFKKGVENYKNKNFSKAKEIFEKVLNNNSKNFSILENLSLVYHELKMYSEAENTLDHCTGGWPLSQRVPASASRFIRTPSERTKSPPKG